jgi:hypothetical protein
MNETFVKARTIFDRMMEDSLARHTAAGAHNEILIHPLPKGHVP